MKEELSQCGTCGQRFRFLKSLRKHELRHQGDGGFFCRTCGMGFTSALAREKHRDKEHKVLLCRICNVKFNTEPEYLHHINSLHEGRNRELCICSNCGKQFKTRGELTHHINSNCGTIKRYKCDVCGQFLMTAGSLINHMLRHNGKRSYMCKFCAKTFVTAGQLTVHERIHTQDKPFICDVCNKGFCHRQSLITHSTLHTGIKPYQCEGCGKSFSCVGNLLKHRRTRKDTCGKIELTSHRVKSPSTKIKVQVNTPPSSKLKKQELQKKIEEAEKIVNANVNLISEEVSSNQIISEEKHVLSKDLSETETSLNDIDESVSFDDFFDNNLDGTASDDSVDLFTRKSKLEEQKNDEDLTKVERMEEKKAQRRKKKQILNDDIEDQCKYCGSVYKNVAWLVKHEEKCGADNKNKFKCSCCSSIFENKDDCLNHQQYHHADLLTCKDCNKIFANPDNVKAHINFYHKGVPRKVYIYVCDKCGKVFKQKALLVLHEEHNCEDGPKFTCDHCNKSFSNKHVLKSHMRVHDPEKTLLCKFCGKSFHWKGQLKIHERSHTGEKPFKCSFCPKSFSYRESLITHSTLHTGIKPHLCTACGSRFSCIGNLLKHRKTHAATCGTANAKVQD